MLFAITIIPYLNLFRWSLRTLGSLVTNNLLVASVLTTGFVDELRLLLLQASQAYTSPNSSISVNLASISVTWQLSLAKLVLHWLNWYLQYEEISNSKVHGLIFST